MGNESDRRIQDLPMITNTRNKHDLLKICKNNKRTTYTILSSLLEVWCLQRLFHISSKNCRFLMDCCVSTFNSLWSNCLLVINISPPPRLTPWRSDSAPRGVGPSMACHLAPIYQKVILFPEIARCVWRLGMFRLVTFFTPAHMQETCGTFMIMNHIPWWKTTCNRCKGTVVTLSGSHSLPSNFKHLEPVACKRTVPELIGCRSVSPYKTPWDFEAAHIAYAIQHQHQSLRDCK